MRGWRPAAGVLLLLATGAPAARGLGPGEPRPFPVDRTQKLIEQEVVYTVEGRVHIPRGVEVTVLRGNTIRAKGSSPAVIEVEGGLDCVGVLGHEVTFENVTVEPCPKYESIHMDMVLLKGSGGVKTGREAAADGYILLENVDVKDSCAIDLVYQGGTVELSSLCADTPVRVRTVPPPGADGARVRINVRNCDQANAYRKCTPHGNRVGLKAGLEVDGGEDVTIRQNRVGGALCALRNWGQRLLFKDNKIDAGKLEFSHAKAGQFQRVQCVNCDISSAEVSVTAPPDPKLKDTLVMDKTWFKGLADPKEVQEKVIRDGADAPDRTGVRVSLIKVEERPHELAGPADR